MKSAFHEALGDLLPTSPPEVSEQRVRAALSAVRAMRAVPEKAEAMEELARRSGRPAEDLYAMLEAAIRSDALPARAPERSPGPVTNDALLRRVPPHSLESERCVAAAAVVHPGAHALARRDADAGDFYSALMGSVFAAAGDAIARGVAEESVPADLVARRICGPVELAQLMDCACPIGSVPHHAQTIRELSQVRSKIVEAARLQDELLQRSGPVESGRELPEIHDGHDVAAMTRAAERALLVRRAPVFHRGGQLVRVRRGQHQATLESLPAPTLLELLSENVAWTRSGRDGSPVPSKPPLTVVSALMARGTWSLREIRTMAEAPCMTSGGRILSHDGWDESGVFVALDPHRSYPSVPEAPTREDAESALGRLLVPFSEFPFVDFYDQSAALALVLSLVARPAIEGNVPLFAVRGPVAASGKGLVVQVAAACAFGRQVAVSPPEKDPSEERKSLLALGAEGAPLALLDNLEHALGSDVLAAALTAPTFRARELGKTRTLEVRLPVLAATGNNLQIKGDLARRCIPVDIDPKVEQPEGRVFLREQPAWALERHPSLCVDALTVLRAFCLAGKPQPHGLKPYGSFEAWSRLVRSALIWCGAYDPCGARERLRAEADTGLAELDTLLTEWSRNLWKWTSCSEAISQSLYNAQLQDALVSVVGGDAKKLTTHRLTWALKARQKRIVRGRRLVSEVHNGITVWGVQDPGTGDQLGRDRQSASAPPPTDPDPEGRR